MRHALMQRKLLVDPVGLANSRDSSAQEEMTTKTSWNVNLGPEDNMFIGEVRKYPRLPPSI